MIKRLYMLVSAVGIALCIVSGMNWVLDAADHRVSEVASATGLAMPVITSVTPDSAPNNVDTPLVISGSDFMAELTGTIVIQSPQVFLDDILLEQAKWVSTTVLTAVVPWGLDAGVYTLTVVNPDGSNGWMANAFTVEQAIGVWTTGGPYGGTINDIAVSPVTSQTAFAVAGRVGVFRTLDGGASWQLVHYNASASGIAYGPAPTYTLYHWGSSVWRSDNTGETWEKVPTEYDAVWSFTPDPLNDRCLWVVLWGHVRRSLDGGTTWDDRNNGLPADMTVRWVVVDPTNSDVVYAGLDNGLVYKTEDGGELWLERSEGLPLADTNHPAQALAVHPFAHDIVVLSRWHETTPGYRSTDGGNTWLPMNIGAEDNDHITDLAFSTQVSGTIYASMMAGTLMEVSFDSGATWSSLGERKGDWMNTLGYDFTGDAPVYLGGGASGTWKSDDKGQNWYLSTNGITALGVDDMAASPIRPEILYVAAEHAGAYMSNNAGHSWSQLDMAFPAAFAVAVDPEHPSAAYVGSVFGIYRNPNGGADWEFVPMPITYHHHIDAIAIAPSAPSVIYAGGRNGEAFSHDQNIGVAFRSSDYGANWEEITVGYPISIASTIAVDPLDSQIVYLATGDQADPMDRSSGLGVFRSTNGGQTWTPIMEGMGHVPVVALAIDPDHPQTLYAAAWLTDTMQAAIYRSDNGGNLWHGVGLGENVSWWGGNLVIDPLATNILYAGTAQGLFRSIDGGVSWTPASGVLGNLTIQDLAIAAADERTIVYVGTTGGMPAESLTMAYPTASTLPPDVVQGGVYQQTIIHSASMERVYLPLILSNKSVEVK
ncbi:MAG: hypothetical protein JXR84_02260 [Anaerolineae bacterium]|nr:hypothetical protein [Anaerolineae bacterium]